MGLIKKSDIDIDLAISIYRQAREKAAEKAVQNNKEQFGAEEVLEELYDGFLPPILMKHNLLDVKTYLRIEHLVEEFDPYQVIPMAEGEKLMACAGIQNVLGALLPICKERQQQQQLKITVHEYKDYLQNEIKKEDCFTINDAGQVVPSNVEMNIYQEKLYNRYEAIWELDKKIRDKTPLDDNDIKMARKKVSECLSNKPNWSERPFLQKFTDILSMGFKPLYRAFISEESNMEKELSHSLKPR